MLARCPHCGLTHTLTRGEELRLDRAHCDACGGDFALFVALEIGGAGERAAGPGISPVRHTESLDIEHNPGRRALELDIDTHPAPEAASPGHPPRHGIAATLAFLLLVLLALQLVLAPPVTPGTWNGLDQARATLCAAAYAEPLCPRWEPVREPGRIRVSSPDLDLTDSQHLLIRLELTSPREQAWPVLDIRLSDRLGTPRGALRLHPTDYRANLKAPMAPSQRYAIEIELPDSDPHITGAQVTLY